MPRSQRPLRQIHPYELSDNFRFRKYYFENFKGGQQPANLLADSSGRTAVTGTTQTIFSSTEQTGTGSSQNVAHGLAAAPTHVLVSVTELPDAAAETGFDVAEGSHDATNVVVTVTNTVKFKVLAILDGTAVTGAGAVPAGTTVKMLTPGGSYWDMYATTAQTILPVGVAGSGLNISCDAVENETVEFVPGGNSSSSRLAYVVGTDSDFFIRVKFKITDVSGYDQFGIGFRKQEAFATPTSFLSTGDGIYTDFFLLGINGEDGVNVQTMSDLNNGGSTTVTDTLFNATDAEVLELEVRVIGGKAIGFINGVRLGNPVKKDGDGTSITSQSTNSTASFTFDSGDTLVPMIFGRHDDEVAEATYLQEIEIGHLVDRGLDPAQV